MPTYYLNVFNSTGAALAEEGTDLPDIAAARTLAIDTIRSIIADEAKGGGIDLRGRIEIADERGTCLDKVAYREAFEISPG